MTDQWSIATDLQKTNYVSIQRMKLSEVKVKLSYKLFHLTPQTTEGGLDSVRKALYNPLKVGPAILEK